MKHKFRHRATVFTLDDLPSQIWPIYIFECENCGVQCRIHVFHFWGLQD